MFYKLINNICILLVFASYSDNNLNTLSLRYDADKQPNSNDKMIELSKVYRIFLKRLSRQCYKNAFQVFLDEKSTYKPIQQKKVAKCKNTYMNFTIEKLLTDIIMN